MINGKYDFKDLVDVIEKLRMPGGCPWDIEQTHNSIKHNLIEEGFELIEAIDGGNGAKMADESGDLLMQIVFHAQIGKEKNEYNIDDVTDAICRKMIHRHPHVFGDEKLENSDEVLNKWDEIKRNDRKQVTIAQELEGVSKYLPSLMRAGKIQKKAEKAGYRFSAENKGTSEEEIGKKIFELVNEARKNKIEPEMALYNYIGKFIEEFRKFENGEDKI